MVQLLRLAVDDGWAEDAAAPELRQRVPDSSVLQLAQANVAKIKAESSGWVIDRAAAIVEGALGRGEPRSKEINHVASCGWTGESPCPRCQRDF
jgi:hypothetical protein